MLLHTRLVPCQRIGSSLFYSLNESPLKPTQPLSLIPNQSRSMSTTEPPHNPGRSSFDFSIPTVYFVKNHDIPHSMFFRLDLQPYFEYPPFLRSCHKFMEVILLDSRIAQPAVARHWLAQITVLGALPDLDTFSILVKSYCKDPHHAYHYVHHLVFTQMKAMGIGPEVRFCQTLVDAVCPRFGPVVGYHLLKELGSSFPIDQLKLPLSCYNSVVLRFCIKKMAEDAETVLALIDFLIYVKEQRLFPDEKIFKRLIRGRGYNGEGFLKAVSIGGQMLAQSIKFKVTVPK